MAPALSASYQRAESKCEREAIRLHCDNYVGYWIAASANKVATAPAWVGSPLSE